MNIFIIVTTKEEILTLGYFLVRHALYYWVTDNTVSGVYAHSFGEQQYPGY